MWAHVYSTGLVLEDGASVLLVVGGRGGKAKVAGGRAGWGFNQWERVECAALYGGEGTRTAVRGTVWKMASGPTAAALSRGKDPATSTPLAPQQGMTFLTDKWAHSSSQ